MWAAATAAAEMESSFFSVFVVALFGLFFLRLFLCGVGGRAFERKILLCKICVTNRCGGCFEFGD